MATGAHAIITFRRLACSLAVLLPIILAQTAPAIGQDAARVRGELRDDFGRLVLDWGQKTAPKVALAVSDSEMVLRFDRAVSLDADAVRANLKAYFRDAILSADGTSLTLPLKKPVTYRTNSAGGRFTLDLGQPGEAVFDNSAASVAEAPPAESAPAEAAPAEPVAPTTPAQPLPAFTQPASQTPGPTPAPATALAPPPTEAPAETASAEPAEPESGMKVRKGEHKDYSRLALDWPDVDFTTRQNGEQVELVFAAPGDLDISALTRDLPSRLRSAATRLDDQGNLILALQVPPNVTASGFRNGKTIVLDLKDGAPPPAAEVVANAAPAAQPVAVAAPAPVSTEAAPAEAAAAETTNVATPPLQSAEPVAALPAPAAETAAPSESAAAQPSAPQIPTPVLVTEEPAATPTAAPPAPVEISAKATPADNGALMTFTFPEPTGLAAFKRGDALWLVFGRPGPIDPAQLIHDAPVLTGLARVDTPYGTALRLPSTARLGGASMGAAISGDGRIWQINLGPNRTLRPTSIADQRRETLGNGGTSLLLQMPNPGAAISLTDPEAGDRLSVVPVMNVGLGLAEGADWPDFRLLASFQGFAIVPISERTRVESLPNGVVVTTLGEIAPQIVSETEPPPAEASPAQTATAPAEERAAPADEGAAPVEGAAAPVTATAEATDGLFDLPAWRRGGEASFTADDAKLRAAVEDAPPSQRPAASLALGEFRFAHGRYPEALEALDQVKGTPMEGDGLVQLLRGAALAMMGREEEAHAVLDDPALDGIPETTLFRGYLAALARDWPKAAQLFGGPLPSLEDYPKPARMVLRRAGAEAKIVANEGLLAQVFLDGIKLDAPNAEDRAYLDYLTGRQQLSLGDKERAAELWRTLADNAVPEVRARSQFDLAELDLAEGKIDAKQAAAALEALRFVWRGGEFEFDLLNRLGELYVESDQPRKGLTTLRQAATNFPTNPKAKDATDAMAKAFYDLYLGNKADRLPPLTAVALYDEFRELTPSGIEGDRMITALADRLVKVDLLDGAAKLLETQVTKRLTGLDKAKAGTRWAAVALLDGRPELALKAIKESEVPDMEPDLIMQRRRLQGRALFETGDTLQSLALIREDESLDGLWLKADLQWRLREWPAAAEALGNLVRAEAARLQLSLPAEPTDEEVLADPAIALIDPLDSEAVAKERDDKFTEVLAPLILNQATALSLANDRGGLRRLARAQGKQMAKGPYATAFATLTSPSANLADSISASMQSVDQLGAFVEDYRTRLRAASLSAPADPAEPGL